MKIFALTILTFTLIGCTTPQRQAPEKPMVLYRYPMSENAVKLAQVMASRDLKDPESAKFRDAFFVTSDDQGEGRDKSKDSWCIEVNGKNGYGAYVGYTWALVPAGGKSVIMGTSPVAAMANKICSSAIFQTAK